MAYVDYAYYTGTYKGTTFTDSASFALAERKAESYLNRETFGNITADTTITDNIKLCLCELADYVQSQGSVSGAVSKANNISSESVDTHSISYVSESESKISFDSKIKDIVWLWLNNPDEMSLLYRGFY